MYFFMFFGGFPSNFEIENTSLLSKVNIGVFYEKEFKQCHSTYTN
jgi:hypothetical protein